MSAGSSEVQRRSTSARARASSASLSIKIMVASIYTVSASVWIDLQYDWRVAVASKRPERLVSQPAAARSGETTFSDRGNPRQTHRLSEAGRVSRQQHHEARYKFYAFRVRPRSPHYRCIRRIVSLVSLPWFWISKQVFDLVFLP